MKKEDLEKLTNSIIEKVGAEKAGEIADDIGLLISDNNNTLTQIEEYENKINKLNTDKENLIKTNGNLLQQISMGNDESIFRKEDKEEKPKTIEYKNLFDSKGNFIN